MTLQTAFIGDVHGHLSALEGVLNKVEEYGVNRIVLLGDYVNKGPNSKGVVDLLSSWHNDNVGLHPLMGNHEEILLHSLNSGDLRRLLQHSGATTIRSYVGGEVGPDVLADFRDAFPESHLEFLKSLPARFYMDDIDASHKEAPITGLYSVRGHYFDGRLPRIGSDVAFIDTGCGSGGYLTAFLWPDRTFVQFTESGDPVSV